jgi:hypothetical protein
VGRQGKAVRLSPSSAALLFDWAVRYFFPNRFGSFATLVAIRRASSLLSSLADERRPRNRNSRAFGRRSTTKQEPKSSTVYGGGKRRLFIKKEPQAVSSGLGLFSCCLKR